MLISFKVKNFRSIRDSIIVDMKADSRKGRTFELKDNVFKYNGDQYLKSVILYGRNASGKSNILTAFRALEYLVTQSDKLKHQQRIPPYEPYLFDKKFTNQPVEFELIFTQPDSIKYKFEVKYTEYNVVYEALYFYPKGSIAKLYERKNGKFNFGEYYKGEKKTIQNEILDNQLFLSRSAQSNIQYLKEAFLFFSESLFVSTFRDIEYDQTIISILSADMLKDPESMNNIKSLLKAADTNIIDIAINQKEKSEFKFPDNIPENVKKDFIERFRYEIKTKHILFDSGKSVGEESLNLDHESLGTRKLIAIGGLILSALRKGGIIIIDELDKSLHPLLTKMLISLFHSERNNPKNAQLVFATHDISLLSNDLFRRDQIYFVEKEFEGNTVLYKLSDIKGVRKDVPYDKWYVSGRFGAIPVISEIDLQISKQ